MRRVLLASALLFAACSDDNGGDDPELGRDASTDAPPAQVTDARVADTVDAYRPALDAQTQPPVDAAAEKDAGPPREVKCVDEQFARLMLFEAPSPGVITEEGTQPGVFQTYIDAQAGGQATSQSFVYGRFTDTGLLKVAIGDEGAFESTEWDIAFRRYVFRLNGGVGGPGEITGARTAPGTTFAGLTSASPELSYRSEAYYTDNCEYVPDVGLGAPSTVLSSFWTYSSCLQMTHNVFVIALKNGRHVKLEVLSYYPPENQQRCDDTGQINLPSGAGQLRIKWSFLD